MIALCMPAIVGTVGLGTLGAYVLPAGAAGLVEEWAIWLFLMAAYGPVLVILASVQAILLTRHAAEMRPVYAAWATVTAGVVATAVFWEFGIDIAPLP